MVMWEVPNQKISVFFIYKLVPYIKKFYSSMKLTTSNTFCQYLPEKNDLGGLWKDKWVEVIGI